ncbi:MAG TPA: hypothetical protein VN737_21315 [Bryobacteraceae bacterium]|nr:hypothetical protein [Bryobacteraceae bacterium]
MSATIVLVRFALLLWLALLTVVSLAPTSLKWRVGTMGPLHNWDHFLAFFVTGVLLCWNAGRVSSWLLRCLAGIAIAAILEGMEAVVYHNPFEWRDLRTDSLGIVLGALAVTGAARLFSAIEMRRASTRPIAIPASDCLSARGRRRTCDKIGPKK